MNAYGIYQPDYEFKRTSRRYRECVASGHVNLTRVQKLTIKNASNEWINELFQWHGARRKTTLGNACHFQLMFQDRCE